MMESVLSQLNSTPGVVGSLMCDPEGHVIAQVFPPVFDADLLKDAATALVDSSAGLENVIGSVGTLDFRYGEARLVAKPIAGATLLVLCTKSINMQLLGLSLSVAIKKFEKLDTLERLTPPALPLPAGAAADGLALYDTPSEEPIEGDWSAEEAGDERSMVHAMAERRAAELRARKKREKEEKKKKK